MGQLSLLPLRISLWLADGHLLPVSSGGHPSVHVCVLTSFFLQGHQACWRRAMLGTPFDPSHLFKDLISLFGYILRY